MKQYIVIIALIGLAITGIKAQTINWQSLQEDQKHGVYFNFGYEYGTTAQFGYTYKINTSKPILLNIDYSFPMGKDLFDDFKFRLGGQIPFVEMNDFKLTAKVLANFKSYKTEMASIKSFGSEFSAIVGYYKPKWHIAAEFGFDKSISSHLKHSEIMKENYPGITDGWYVPTGGNFFYGLEASKTLGKTMDLSFRIGMTNAEGDDENAILTNYTQLGIIKRF